MSVDPANPSEALRLAREYPEITTAMLASHEGRAYTNLVAAYCLLWPKERNVPVLLRKLSNRTPYMALLVAGWVAPYLEKGRYAIEFSVIKMNAIESDFDPQTASDFARMVWELSDAPKT